MNNTLPPSGSGVSPSPKADPNRQLLSSLDQQRHIRLQAIQTRVGLRIGETIQAVIEKVSARTLASQTETNQPTTTPSTLATATTSVPASSNPTPAQQQLLTLLAESKNTTTAPQVNQVELKIGAHVISVLTALPLKQGQLIALTLTAAGDLKLLSDPLGTPKISAELTQALRRSLPNQRPVTEFVQQLKQILQNPVLNQVLLTPAIRQPLTQALNLVLQATPVADSPALKNAVANSGIQFENKLRQLSLQAIRPKEAPAFAASAGDSSNQTKTAIPAVAQQDFKGLLLNLKQALEKTAALPATQTPGKSQISPTATGQPPPSPHAAAPTNKNMVYNPTGRLLATGSSTSIRGTDSRDIAAPERLQPSPALPASALNPAGGVSSDTPKIPANPMSATTLPMFTSALAQFFAGGVKQAGEFDIKQLRTQMTVLLHRQLLQTLASITGKQAMSMGRQQTTGSEGATLLQLNLELPLRMGEHIVPLHLDIEEKPNQDSKTKNNSREKARRWEVRMSFELPDDGNLHAHIRLLQTTVSASLWAEQPGLLAKAKEQLTNLRANLEKNGITVDKIDCQQGKPPEQVNALGYALVDIKT